MLFSLRMAVLLHKWEFKNIEVEFLKVSEPGLPHIGARKSWDFLILTVSASTGCLTEISQPRHLTWYSTQSHYTDTELTSSDSLIYFLNAEHQTKEQLVPFLEVVGMVGHKAEALPIEPLYRFGSLEVADTCTIEIYKWPILLFSAKLAG